MRIARIVGLCVAAASSAVGLYGLYNTKPLPLSQRLGRMAPLDLDHDGRISAQEWAQAGRPNEAMAALDRDKSGYLEPQEARARRTPKGGH